MLLIQYVVILLVLLVLFKSFINLGKRKISILTFIFILLLLEILMIFVFVPGIVVAISELLNIERGKDFMIYSAIAILFYLIFRTYIKIELLDRDLSKLIKKISLNQLK